jgi:hypothetical protein
MDFFGDFAAITSTVAAPALPNSPESGFDGVDYEKGSSQTKLCVVA